MKVLFVVVALTLSSVAFAKESANDCFKAQVELASQNASSYDYKGNVKALNAGLKSCRDAAKLEVAATKKLKLKERIAKLQAQLGQ